MHDTITLTPAQQAATDLLLGGIRAGGVHVLRCAPGMGRTTILRKIHETTGGALLGIRDFLRDMPVEPVEAFLRVMERALNWQRLVLIDDWHLMTAALDWQSRAMMRAAVTAVLDHAAEHNQTLLFATDGVETLSTIMRRCHTWIMEAFTAGDYERICGSELGPLDFARIHRFAPALNGHQLRKACIWLRPSADTDRFIEYLRAQNLTSNVEIAEVAPVDWHDLKGVDDLIEALEAKIALPLENDALATELQLKPKRGVLLAGPPGTGKTTIGRALAHRLKSKFFLIDGTMIAGSDDFHEDVSKVFDEAKKNAPAIIFIDDTDVIFEGGNSSGFYRYLLTMLDGLESASAERVCVMMTAMNVSSLPAAMLRSGRVELWLETRLPDAAARESILRERLHKLPPPICQADVSLLASASRGLTGADLRAVVEDGKLMLAHDRARGKPLRPVEDYFLEALETVRSNRRNYARRKPSPVAEEVKLGFVGQ
jgi:predicted AAA+ superfamily ATPase